MSGAGGSDDVHAALMKRAQATSRRFTLIVIAIAVLSSFALVYFAVGDFFGHSGILFAKVVGITGGLTFVGTFASVLGAGIVISRHLLITRLRAWADEAVKAHNLEPTELDYIVAMYAKQTRRREMELDEINPPRRRRQ